MGSVKGVQNPRQIYERYRKGELDRNSIVEIFKSIIEDETVLLNRISAIEFLGEIKPYSNKLYGVLEYYVISDVNPEIRLAAVKAIINNYLELGFESVKWVISHDNSNLVLMNIIELLDQKNDDTSKVLQDEILQRFSNIFQVVPLEAKFLIDLFNSLNHIGESLDLNANYTNKFSFKNASLHHCNTGFYAPKIISVRNKHVYTLQLGGFELKELPKSISLLRRLRFLTIYDTNLHDLPKSIKKLKHLSCLKLARNNFKKLPKSISKLRNLRSLILHEGSLKYIPKWIGKLHRLSFLQDLSGKIRKIPSSLINISNQKFVKRYINLEVEKTEAPILALLELLSDIPLVKIESFEDEFDSEKFDPFNSMYCFKLNDKGNVIRLYLYSYHYPLVWILPKQIGLLKYIKRICLYNNTIPQIPKNIGNLKSLEILDLSKNSIKKIPRAIKKLKSLQNLDLSMNQIKKIPRFFKNDSILKKIDLLSNPVCKNRKLNSQSPNKFSSYKSCSS
ncbi:MAG: leucine-rich repeat domain-containing protein [Promethearchaeota archaeon]